MSSDLFSRLEALDLEVDGSRETILRAPFGYPGGKLRALKEILPFLPHRRAYVEAFGGTGVILLNRKPSKLEVLNDRYAGICAFYQCFNDLEMTRKLCERLNRVVHSREMFHWCKATWEEVNDPIERAARWYYMLRVSFGQLGRNFGRSTDGVGSIGNKIRPDFSEFLELHRRLRCVQVENQDWLQCLRDYDAYDTVFYLDPPYYSTQRGTYVHHMDQSEHRKLCEVIFSLKGFVALSGYDNPIYGDFPWSDFHTWDQQVSITTQAFEGTTKDLDDRIERGEAKECLWIKE